MAKTQTLLRKDLVPWTVGQIHSVETCGSSDGPGVRFVTYLQGCPLSCAYCHNPDCRKFGVGKEMYVEDVIEELKRYRPYFRATRGGLTVSGGEPFMQPEFLAELLRRAKEEGIHTAVDTSGFVEVERAEEALQYTDLVLLDIKSFDAETHQRVTGVKPQKIWRFANYLAEIKKPAWIRFVLVPGWTDQPHNVSGVAKFISTLRNVERVDVLPFHKMGEYKWKELGEPYKLAEIKEPTLAQVVEVISYFRKHGLPAC